MRSQRAISIALGLIVAACAPYDDPFVFAADASLALEPPQPTVAHKSTLDPVAPLRIGDAPVDASDAQQRALWWVNTYRIRAGLGPLDQRADLNRASAAHAAYVLLNPDLYDDDGMSVHEEAPFRTGFYGERFWERMQTAGYGGQPFREVIAYQAKPAAAVSHWMETVYHRLPLLHPSAQHLGYAEAELGKSRINVLDIGAGDGLAPSIPSGVAWPPDGATDVALSWDGLESPQPPAPPGGYPSGPVITLTFGAKTDLAVLQHEVVDAETGESLPHTLLTPENDPNLEGETSLAMYTHDPLAPGRVYEVRVRGVVDGAELYRVWTFTTRATDHCSLVTQDCGVGRACYGTSEAEGVCAWAGARSEGAACDYQNDCDVGLTCVGGTCRRYCTLDTSAIGCDTACLTGHTPVDKAGGVGVCSAI